MIRIVMFVVSIAILAGCQSTDYIGNEDSYRYRIPTGSSLVLNEPIVIPSNRSTIYMFRGEIVPYKKIDVYYPHCQLRMKKSSSQARTIKPDTFKITKIFDYAKSSSKVRVTLGVGVRIGAIGHIGVGISPGGRGRASSYKYITKISLLADSQPGLKYLVCSHWGNRGNIEAVTIHEIRDVLGDIFSLNIKTKQ